MVARARRPRLLFALLMAAALVLTACSDGQVRVGAVTGSGWSTFGGNGANSNFTAASIPDDLQLSWTRPMGAPITAPLSISTRNNVGATSMELGGCNLMVLDANSGRKNFCKRMQEGVAGNTLLVDQLDQPYIGERGMLLAFNAGGAIRWRIGIAGVPVSAKIAAPGAVLATSTHGQLLLINGQTGDPVAPVVNLWPGGTPPEDPLTGLADCGVGGPECMVPAPAAVDSDNERFFLNVWEPGAPAAEIRAFGFAAHDGSRKITELWRAPLPGGAIGPATVSADRETVYGFGRAGALVALDADTGQPRWSHDIDAGFATLATAPDGLIIPTAQAGEPLIALRDNGDSVEEAWRRDDVASAGLAAITGSNTAWLAARDENAETLSLIEVSGENGETLRTLPLPGSRGFVTGVAVSAAGQIATATHAGEVYFFNSRERMS